MNKIKKIQDASEAIDYIDSLLENINDFFYFNEEINNFLFYINRLEKLIDKEEDEELNAIKEKSKDPTNINWSYHYPIHWEIIFRKNISNGFIASLWSLCESYLDRYCDIIYYISFLDLRYNEIRKSNKVDMFKKYFEIHFYDITNINWDEIERIYNLRNILAHSNGFISKDKKIPQSKNIKIKDDEIIFHNDYFAECCNILKTEFNKINKLFVAFCIQQKNNYKLSIK